MKYGKKKMVLVVLAGLAATGAVFFLLSAPETRAATLEVTSPADGGHGTLRQCLLDAEKGDTITFDPNAFPEGNPVTIAITSGRLPNLDEGDVTIDGAGAGVIIDGSSLSSEFDDGLRITSHRNTIKGLTIQNFPGDGVDIFGGAQGNRVENCAISGNGQRGVRVAGSSTTGNTITRNSITGNDGSGIIATDGGNVELAPPIINSAIISGSNMTAAGLALPGVVVELFADPGFSWKPGFWRARSEGHLPAAVVVWIPVCPGWERERLLTLYGAAPDPQSAGTAGALKSPVHRALLRSRATSSPGGPRRTKAPPCQGPDSLTFIRACGCATGPLVLSQGAVCALRMVRI